MTRNSYDLTHYSHTCGKVGRLQTLSVIPIVAGDSIDLNFEGMIRFAPLRKEVVQDAQVDIFYFFRPHRHQYEDDWLDMIKTGYDSTTVLPLHTPTPAVNISANSWLGQPDHPDTLPAWLPGGYNAIWNRYFKNPDLDDEDLLTLSGEDRKYGYGIARLAHEATRPRRMNAAAANQYNDMNDEDAQINVPVVGATATLDIRNLEKVKAQYRTEIDTNWFANRYNDIMKSKWKSSINVDADVRPELCYRHSFMLSGQEINGTGDANLGTYQGKTIGRADHSMPRKYFGEHGSLWIMAAVRFPFVHTLEKHYISTVTQPDYMTISGDPTLWAAEEPQRYYANKHVSTATFADADYVEPYGQWYRYQPSRIHENFRALPGYPFLKTDLSNIDTVFYHKLEEYDSMFETSQIGHWQIHSMPKINAQRHIVDPRASIYAGT